MRSRFADRARRLLDVERTSRCTDGKAQNPRTWDELRTCLLGRFSEPFTEVKIWTAFINLAQGSNDITSYVSSFTFAAQQTEETLPEMTLMKHLLVTVSNNLRAAYYALDTRPTTFDELRSDLLRAEHIHNTTSARRRPSTTVPSSSSTPFRSPTSRPSITAPPAPPPPRPAC